MLGHSDAGPSLTMRARLLLLLLLGLLALGTELAFAFGKKRPPPPKVKPGVCPTPKEAGICLEKCASDWSCLGAEKCCSNGCGHVCMGPVFPEKPGECPKFKIPPGWPCKKSCLWDHDCKGHLKCCPRGCGTTCFAPGPSASSD